MFNINNKIIKINKFIKMFKQILKEKNMLNNYGLVDLKIIIMK